MDRQQRILPVRKEGYEISMEKRNHVKLRAIFSSLILAIAVFLEVYVMMNDSKNYVLLAVFGILAVVTLYLLLDNLFKLDSQKKKEFEEYYENLAKTEKATYLMLKKNFGDLEDRINVLEKTLKVPTEDIIDAQKAVAKVTINRSRENSDAILNSNDNLMEELIKLRSYLENANSDMKGMQKSLVSEQTKEMLLKQQEILTGIKDMAITLQQDIVNGMSKTAVSYIPAPTVVPAEPVQEEVPATEPVEEAFEEPEAISEPEVAVVIANADALAPEPESMPESEAQEEAPTEAPVEEKPAMPDLSDPNHVMTPEEIAAMIANADALTGAEEVNQEVDQEIASMETETTPDIESPELTMEEQIIDQELEKPAMPELSDPNKMMTPEEIAALIASI